MNLRREHHIEGARATTGSSAYRGGTPSTNASEARRRKGEDWFAPAAISIHLEIGLATVYRLLRSKLISEQA